MSVLKRLNEQRPDFLAGILVRLVRLISSTMRVKTVGQEKYPSFEKCLLCGWHGKSFVFANRFRGKGYWVIISNSNDGDMQNHIFTQLGYQSIRGSTGRGGARVAMQGVRVLRDGGTMAMTPDGPRGPSGEVQGGVMLMAQRSGSRLIPVGVAAKPCKRFRSWDRYMIPYPFSKGVIVFGDAFEVPLDATDEQVEQIRLEFQRAIHACDIEAERLAGHPLESLPLPPAAHL